MSVAIAQEEALVALILGTLWGIGLMTSGEDI